MKKISEGAEAIIYSEVLFGHKTILKSRKPKLYRTKQLDLQIRRQRTKKEAKLMKNAAKAGISVPKVLGVSQTSILMEKIEGKLLKDIKISKSQIQKSGKILAKLHHAKIAHGDFTPANLIASGDKVYVIDFGLSEPTNSPEEKALDILLMKRQLPSRLYDAFIKSYSESSSDNKTVLARLAKIEERGRYQSRTLI